MTHTYSFTYVKIFVIESLPDGERLTGKELYDDTIQRKIEQKGLEINHQLFNVFTKEDFFNILKCINEEVIENEFHPIIHFEIHGVEDGFVLKSLEIVKWEEMAGILRNINLSSNNNTLLTLCVCYGIYIYKLIEPNESSPYWGTISPKEEILPFFALGAFQTFFEKLLETKDINVSVNAMNDEYDKSKTTFYFRNARFAFDLAYENCESNYFSEEIIESRVNDAFVLGKVQLLEDKNIRCSDEDLKSIIRFNLTNPEIKAKMKNDTYLKFTNNGEFSN